MDESATAKEATALVETTGTEEVENEEPQIDCSTLPDFPEILSFFDKFSVLLDLQNPVLFSDLKNGAENSKTSVEWRLLHCQLMRRINKTFKAERWTQELLKLCAKFGLVAENVEGGYTNLPIETKLDILKLLCDLQFTSNVKFKEKVEALDSAALRTEPVGRDKHGSSYFYFQDSECNLYLFSSPGSAQEKFEVVATDRETFVSAIDRLRSEVTPAPAKEEPETKDQKDENEVKSERAASASASQNEDQERLPAVNTSTTTVDERSGATSSAAANTTRSSSAADLTGDSPEKARGTNSPIVSASSATPPKSSRGRKSNSTPSKASKKAAKSPKKRGRKKSKKVAKNGRGKAPASNKKKKEEISDESSDESSRSSSEKSSESSEDDDEQEVPLAVIKAAGGRTPRAAAAKAAQKLRTPTKQVGKSPVKPASPSVESSESESEEEEQVEEEEDEYIPSSAKKRGRGRGRGKAVTPAPPKFMPLKPGGKWGSKKAPPEPEPIDSSDIEDDTECGNCHKFNHPSKLLLCDKCENGVHTFCLVPAIIVIPEGEWFCPICEHRHLIDRLAEILIKLDIDLKELAKKQAREKAGRKELSRLMDDPWYAKRASKTSLEQGEGDHHHQKSEEEVSSQEDEGADFGVRSCRRKHKVDYSLIEYDKKLNDAISGKYVGEEGQEKTAVRKARNRGEEEMQVESEEEEEKGEDFTLPDWVKAEQDEEGSTPKRGRSRQSKESDDEYRPSEEEEKPRQKGPPKKQQQAPAARGGAGRGRGRKKRRGDSEYEDEEDEYVPTPPPKKELKKRPKNWEEEDYHTSWDEGSESEWDSDEMSDFGGKKRKKKTDDSAVRRRKRPRFLYASSDSDSDNRDYDAYKQKSKIRHRGRRQFPSSDEEKSGEEGKSESSSSEEESSGSEFDGRKKRKKPSTEKVKKALAKKNGGEKKKEIEYVHRSLRLATRERVDYGKYLDDEEEKEAKAKKRQQESQLGKIRLPFEAEEAEDDEEEERSSPELTAAPKPKPKKISSDEDEEEEDEEEDFGGKKSEEESSEDEYFDEDEDQEETVAPKKTVEKVEKPVVQPPPVVVKSPQTVISSKPPGPVLSPVVKSPMTVSAPPFPKLSSEATTASDAESEGTKSSGSGAKLPVSEAVLPKPVSAVPVLPAVRNQPPPPSLSQLPHAPLPLEKVNIPHSLMQQPPVPAAKPHPFSLPMPEITEQQQQQPPMRQPQPQPVVQRPPVTSQPYGGMGPVIGGGYNPVVGMPGQGAYYPTPPSSQAPLYSPAYGSAISQPSGYPAQRPPPQQMPPGIYPGYIPGSQAQPQRGYQAAMTSPYFQPQQQPWPGQPQPHPAMSYASYDGSGMGGYPVISGPMRAPVMPSHLDPSQRPPYMQPGQPMMAPQQQQGQQIPGNQNQPGMGGPPPAPAGSTFDDFDLEDLGPSAPRAEPVQ